MKKTINKFPERLKQRRKELGMCQAELSRRIFVTQSVVCGYESGKALPSISTLIIIADALDVSIDWLLGREE